MKNTKTHDVPLNLRNLYGLMWFYIIVAQLLKHWASEQQILSSNSRGAFVHAN